jgi:hypothetical protein
VASQGVRGDADAVPPAGASDVNRSSVSKASVVVRMGGFWVVAEAPLDGRWRCPSRRLRRPCRYGRRWSLERAVADTVERGDMWCVARRRAEVRRLRRTRRSDRRGSRHGRATAIRTTEVRTRRQARSSLARGPCFPSGWVSPTISYTERFHRGRAVTTRKAAHLRPRDRPPELRTTSLDPSAWWELP